MNRILLILVLYKYSFSRFSIIIAAIALITTRNGKLCRSGAVSCHSKLFVSTPGPSYKTIALLNHSFNRQDKEMTVSCCFFFLRPTPMRLLYTIFQFHDNSLPRLMYYLLLSSEETD